MAKHEHDYDPALRGVELVQHLGSAHGFHSSNELEDDDSRHRELHGVESRDAARIREVRDAAWKQGYEACRRGEQPHSPYRAPRPEVEG